MRREQCETLLESCRADLKSQIDITQSLEADVGGSRAAESAAAAEIARIAEVHAAKADEAQQLAASLAAARKQVAETVREQSQRNADAEQRLTLLAEQRDAAKQDAARELDKARRDAESKLSVTASKHKDFIEQQEAKHRDEVASMSQRLSALLLERDNLQRRVNELQTHSTEALSKLQVELEIAKSDSAKNAQPSRAVESQREEERLSFEKPPSEMQEQHEVAMAALCDEAAQQKQHPQQPDANDKVSQLESEKHQLEQQLESLRQQLKSDIAEHEQQRRSDAAKFDADLQQQLSALEQKKKHSDELAAVNEQLLSARQQIDSLTAAVASQKKKREIERSGFQDLLSLERVRLSESEGRRFVIETARREALDWFAEFNRYLFESINNMYMALESAKRE